MGDITTGEGWTVDEEGWLCHQGAGIFQIGRQMVATSYVLDALNRSSTVPDLTALRDDLANAMCRHSLIGDWFEKADLVIADLLDEVEEPF